ncbi:MAG: hypothetical protein KGI79_00330 [Patescibacteria group bacterium]|nr:hypothetical protein [Patescibacteria group bacterium]MDE2116317.1 hypothetical protein [Patescibacteria group bacterium]
MKDIPALFKDRTFLKLFLGAVVLLAAALIINFYAGTYATKSESNYVTDIILSNIPVFDVDAVFIYGGYALVAIVLLVCFAMPRRMPFTIKAIALFYVIRSIFVTLTHIAPFPTHIVVDASSLIHLFDFDGELFFSGHTGLPFLMALLYWDNKYLRVGFIALSVFLGAVVLMGHVHYSIDVFSAFFITYAIYGIAEQVFKKDKEFGNAATLLP